jgi:hypothetical protein
MDCDLIVMGMHGRSGIARVLMGSVTEEVVRRAHCPALAVKSPFPESLLVPATQTRGPVALSPTG